MTKTPSRTSLRHTRDAPILADLLDRHASARPRIIDVTYGKGGIWGRLPIRKSVVKCDLEAFPGLDKQTDWRDLPRHFSRASFDVLVADVIQVGDVGANSRRYNGYVSKQNPLKGTSIAPLFPGIFDSAEYLLRPRTGVMLFKLVDLVRSSRFQFESRRLAEYAEKRGWTFCQYVAMWSPPTTISTTNTSYHVDNGCALWCVLRYGPSCCGPGKRLRHELVCQAPGPKHTFWARRSDAATCSARCRKVLERAV